MINFFLRILTITKHPLKMLKEKEVTTLQIFPATWLILLILTAGYVDFIKYQLGNPALPRLLKITPVVYPHLNDFTGKLYLRY